MNMRFRDEMQEQVERTLLRKGRQRQQLGSILFCVPPWPSFFKRQGGGTKLRSPCFSDSLLQ